MLFYKKYLSHTIPYGKVLVLDIPRICRENDFMTCNLILGSTHNLGLGQHRVQNKRRLDRRPRYWMRRSLGMASTEFADNDHHKANLPFVVAFDLVTFLFPSALPSEVVLLIWRMRRGDSLCVGIIVPS